MDFSKISDRIPYLDGGFRRKVFAGVPVFAAIVIFFTSQSEALKATPIVIDKDNITIALISMIIIFAIGSVVEIFAEYFVKRGVGNIIWCAQLPVKAVNLKTKSATSVLRFLIYFYSAPFMVIAALVMGVFGYCPYRLMPTDIVSRKAVTSLNKLPPLIADSFKDPYGDHFDASWRNVAVQLSATNRQIVFAKFASCSDLVTMITTILFVFFIFFGGQFSGGSDGAAIANSSIIVNVLFSGFGISAAMIALSYSYFFVLRGAIRNCLELYSMEQNGFIPPQEEVAD